VTKEMQKQLEREGKTIKQFVKEELAKQK